MDGSTHRRAGLLALALATLLAPWAAADETKLRPGRSAAGVTRQPPRTIGEGPDYDAPALAVSRDGRVYVALVSYAGGREQVWLREAASPSAPLELDRQVSDGVRAWGPRLAVAPEGDLWLAWCGTSAAPARGEHIRQVHLRRVGPGEPGPVQVVSTAPWACAPDLDVGPDGRLHLAWESWTPERPTAVRIAYRSFDTAGAPLGEAVIVGEGPFDRRPDVLVAGDGAIHLAWDRLVDTAATGAAEPDYDVLLRTQQAGAWGPPVAVDARDGIQAAPDLAPGPAGEVWIAYHSGHRHPSVKWWSLRRLRGDRLETLAVPDPAGAVVPSGEQQGAEFPALAVRPDGLAAVVSRPSQGAYLHLATGAGVSPPLDLTRRGWGCRGMRAAAVFAPDGSLLAVRRARHGVVLERVTLAPSVTAAGPPAFAAVNDLAKAERVQSAPTTDPAAPPGAAPAGAPTTPEAAAATDADTRVLLGDVHMHSAVSDGTGPPDEIYARAWTRGLDFAVLTDHDSVIGSRFLPSEHDTVAWVTDLFDAREGFATLHAYEWTTPPVPTGAGHRNVYFRGHAPTPVYGYKDGYRDTASLLTALRTEQAFVAPHHTGWTGTDWAAADQEIQRHVEIVSVHGAFEFRDNQPIPPRGSMAGMFVRDGLRRGLRFGFLGGSDSHGLLWHHGVGRRADPWSHGFTGALAHGDTRTDLYDALHARRTFATSGARMTARLTVSGVPQGGAGRTTTPPEIRGQLTTTAPLETVVLVRDGQVLHRVTFPLEDARTAYTLDLTDDQVTPGDHHYYLRAVQRGSNEEVDVVWTSPVFLTVDR